MNFVVTTAGGERKTLAAALRWEIVQTGGVPCDSISVTTLWDGGDDGALDWLEILAEEGGVAVFRGLVDECRSEMTAAGLTFTLSGRGMAARLLDNEAVGRDYQLATVDDILANHVRPYGLSVGGVATAVAVANFSVATGRSEWGVLEDFCQHQSGIAPWLDGCGALYLTERGRTASHRIGDDAAVTAMTCVHRRYGVISEVLLRSRDETREISVKNEPFLSLGGRCRRVMTITKSEGNEYAYNEGQALLDRTAEGLMQVEVTVAQPLFGLAGAVISLMRSGCPWNGVYRVMESAVSLDENGCETTLTLCAVGEN